MLDLLDNYFPNSLILLRYNVIIDVRKFLYGWRIAVEMARRCGLPNRQMLGKPMGLRRTPASHGPPAGNVAPTPIS